MAHARVCTGEGVALTYLAALEDHYTRNWSVPTQRLRVTRGRGLTADFRVLVIPRTDGALAYATCGMSGPLDQEKLELFILVRQGCDVGPAPGVPEQPPVGLVDLLAAVADYHLAGASLGLHHTVNLGQPWLAGSACSFGYLSQPYLDGPQLEWMDEPRVRFLWLIPITPAEREFKVQFGADALEVRFETAQFDYLNPLRPCVIGTL